MDSLRVSFIEKLIELAQRKAQIVVLDCDMGRHNKLNLFKEAYPKQFYQMGISEQNAISVAAGMAKGGMIPIVSSFAAFICGKTWEQIRHSVVYNNANVKIFATHAGLSAGEDGATHQCIEDFALMMAIPKIHVFAPAFVSECNSICDYMIKSSIPAYIRVGRDVVDYDINYTPTIGDPIVLGNKNSKTVVISTGEITHEVIKAFNICHNFKIVHIGALRPLNTKKLYSELKNAEKIFVIEEHTKFGGLLSILYLSNVFNTSNIVHMSMSESFGQTGTVEELRNFYGLSAQHIVEKIEKRDSIV